MAKKLYTVTAGDSLTKIATAQLGDKERWREIAYINQLHQPYLIFPGQVILLPDDTAPPIDIVLTPDKHPDDPPPDTRHAAADPAMVWLGVGIAAVILWGLVRG